MMLRIKKSIENVSKFLYHSAEWIVTILIFLMVSFLTFQVFWLRFNTENSIPEKLSFWMVLAQILIAILFLAVCILAGKILERFYRKIWYLDKIILAIVLTGIFIWGWNYLSDVRFLPGSDQYACYSLALRFLNSDFGAVVPTGSYLSLWPFQTGFIFILEKQMRIFQTTEVLFFQKINLCYLILMMISGYGMLRKMTKRLDASLIYLGIVCTHCSLLFRITDLYGDLPAWSLFSFATWMLLVLKDEKRMICRIGAGGYSSLRRLGHVSIKGMR